MNDNRTPVCDFIIDEREDGLYARIRAVARRKYSSLGDVWQDVAHETWLIALQRGYFDRRMLREAARNIGLWHEAPAQPYSAQADPDPEGKLATILDSLDNDKARKVIQMVKQGSNITEACRLSGIGYCAFIRACRKAWERRDQCSLFRAVAA
jgi:hypothetical protein